MRFLISSDPRQLQAALAGYKTATVEAEYGDTVVEGSVLTMAHHGARAGQPAPCSYSNGCGQEIEVVGLSHIDLDSLGGCAAILGRKPEMAQFWEVAEFVDLHGVHKLALLGASESDRRRIHAYWAWGHEQKLFAPRDGSVIDITDHILRSVDALAAICADDPQLLAAGDAFRIAGERLNADSYVEMKGEVIVRVAPAFTNHIYTTPDGAVAKAVVALRVDAHSITVSLADPIPNVSCLQIVQSLWGEKAGGHVGIAGSPRDQRMGLDELVKIRDVAAAALSV